MMRILIPSRLEAMAALTVSSIHSPATEHPATEPVAAHGPEAALSQGPISSIFVKNGHEKENFSALTENLTGEFVFSSAQPVHY